jgi:hypothetical protein
MEKKRRDARTGVAALVPGIVLVALSVYAFTRGGAEVLGVWAVGVGLGLSALGVTLIRRAKNAR